MSANNTVKIALITGYLGAGKTTLLNHILANDEGIRAAVIVNDIGEVNVDADLIEKGGIVTQENSNLVPLTNGCICCTLRDDLANQLRELAETKKYDYIIIEASGICEPIPIAQTIADICEESTYTGLPMELDNIIAVVDCARMHDEFEDGRSLTKDSIEEEDIENLLIQQLEFCNTVLLNKVDMVTPKQLGLLKEIVRSLQTSAVIIEANYAKVKIADVLNTGRFDLEKSMESAGWIEAIQNPDDDDDDEHEHHHHDDDDDEHEHHHHHDDDDDDDDEHEHHHHHHHHHADEIFQSWGMETPKKCSKEELRAVLSQSDDAERFGSVMRAKGIVDASDGEWIYFDYVPGEIDLRRGAAAVTGRFCVIGSHINENALKELFKLG